jgi:hypothetical protein
LKSKLSKYNSVDLSTIFSIIHLLLYTPKAPNDFCCSQVDDAIWVAQKAKSAIKSDWEDATPLMKELELKPKLLMFKSWLWAFATV